MSNTKPSVRELIKAAKLPEKTVELCLRGDLVAEWEDLDRQLRQQDSGDKRLVGSPNSKRIATRMQKLEQEMTDSTVVFRLRALSRRAFMDFLAAHPPREDDERDQLLGYNRETYFADLTRTCLVEPVLDDDEWEPLLEALSARQWDVLSATAVSLNTDDVSVPFSVAASHILQPSDEK